MCSITVPASIHGRHLVPRFRDGIETSAGVEIRHAIKTSHHVDKTTDCRASMVGAGAHCKRKRVFRFIPKLGSTLAYQAWLKTYMTIMMMTGQQVERAILRQGHDS